MDQIIEQMLKQHDTQTAYDKKNSASQLGPGGSLVFINHML